MMWKLFFVAFLAVGVLCDDLSLTPDNVNKLEDALKAQCKKNNAEDKVDQVKTAGKTFIDCVKDLFNFQTIEKEIEEAKPNGALDEVFGKYCAKSPQLKTCFHTLTAAVSPCLDTKARESVTTVNNAADQLVDFVCFKDGDRIALFIAEKGPECFKEKSDAIRECGNTIKERYINNSGKNVSLAVELSLTEQCNLFDELSSCVVKALEGCDTPTPANMSESLFKFVRKGSRCKDVPAKN